MKEKHKKDNVEDKRKVNSPSCPRCGTNILEYVGEGKASEVIYWRGKRLGYVGAKYECKRCGYRFS